MTTTINYTVFKIQEINNETSGFAHNNISYETNEFTFKKPFAGKKYSSFQNIRDQIELKTPYTIPGKGNFSDLFEWHLN
jgi:hypothetical protein